MNFFVEDCETLHLCWVVCTLSQTNIVIISFCKDSGSFYPCLRFDVPGPSGEPAKSARPGIAQGDAQGLTGVEGGARGRA